MVLVILCMILKHCIKIKQSYTLGSSFWINYKIQNSHPLHLRVNCKSLSLLSSLKKILKWKVEIVLFFQIHVLSLLLLSVPILMIDWNLFTARERVMYSLAKEQSCLCKNYNGPLTALST